MLITTLTGQTAYDNIRNQKSYANVLLQINYAAADSILNYKVSAGIQRKNGSNMYLFNKVALVDLMLISALDDFNTLKDVAGTTYNCVIKLAESGNLAIEDGEEIVLSIEGANATHSIKVYGIEEPADSQTYKYYESKVLLSEFTNVKLTNLDQFDVMSLDKLNQLVDLTITYDNGEQIRYLPEELKYLARSVDFFALVSTSATASIIMNEFDNRLVLPVHAVQMIEFNKNSGQIMNATFSTEKHLNQ